MADEQDNNSEAPKKKSGPSMMTLIVVLGVMLVEGIAVVALMTVMRGGASAADAAVIEGEELASAESFVELELVSDRFQNLQTGKVWIWEADIRLRVREKNREFVETELANREGEVTEGIREIFARAQHLHLKEPGQATIKRQLTAFLHDIFGDHPDGEPRIDRVLLPTFKGLQSRGSA
ncbi:MAG: hypothetical protein AAF747_10445 [Planctomycetota bacterium]